MTLEEFGRFMQTKSVGRIEPPDNEQLTERVFTAQKHIARDTVVFEYRVSELSEDTTILRRLDEHTWIRFPKKPIMGSRGQIDIDDVLLDALALYVMAGLELQRSKVLMAMYWEEIDMHNQRLTETYLEEASNDAARYYQFG